MTYTLMPHQTLLVGQTNNHKLWHADVGTGKTLAALHLLASRPGPHLVFAPLPAFAAWIDDVKWFNVPVDLLPLDKFALYDHVGRQALSVSERSARMNMWVGNPTFKGDVPQVVLVNYEAARSMVFDHIAWDTIIADECQHLGSQKSATSRHLAVECRNAQLRVAMTGTWVDDGLRGGYGIFRWLFPARTMTNLGVKAKRPISALFGTYQTFEDTFAVMRNAGGRPFIAGYRNKEDFAAIVQPHVIRVVDHEKRPVVLRDYTFDLPAKALKAYKELDTDGITQLANEYNSVIYRPNVLSRLMALHRLSTSGVAVDTEGVEHHFDIKPRLDTLKYILDLIGDDTPALIFTVFKADVELIGGALRQWGISYARLTGDYKEAHVFQSGKARVLIANVDAANAGIRLERACHTILYSMSYSNTKYRQLLGRTNRKGQQSDTVYVHRIVANGTVDGAIYNALIRKDMDREEVEQLVLGDDTH